MADNGKISTIMITGNNSSTLSHYFRTDRVLTLKFHKYLIPTVLTALAFSLNEFVDSMIVSNLIDPNAMTVVNIGVPIMLIYAGIYTLIGAGGANVYALKLGAFEGDEAGHMLFSSVIYSLLSGIVIMVVGLTFIDQLAGALCRDETLFFEFRSYLMVLLLSAPVLIPVQTFSSYMPSCGIPHLATVINIVANAANLVLDVIYISVFKMGVAGAAYATLTGYAISLLVIIIYLLIKKPDIRFKHTGVKESLILIGSAATYGFSYALVQIGYSLKFEYCNARAFEMAGAYGQTAFSMGIQLMSIVSIFLAGISGAALPILASLHGQRDSTSQEMLLKRIIIYTLVISAALVLVFEAFPANICRIYNLKDKEAISIAVSSIRILSVTFLIRGVCQLVMGYLQATGRRIYAMVISLVDGIGIIPIAFVLSKVFALNGIFAAFIADAVIVLILIIVINAVISNKNPGRYSLPFLVEQDTEALSQISLTFSGQKAEIGDITEKIKDWSKPLDLSKKKGLFLELDIEEMLLYILKGDTIKDIDILIKRYTDEVLIDFRSIGAPLNPMEITPDDDFVNLTVLQKTADKIEYEYLMGMNCSRVTIME